MIYIKDLHWTKCDFVIEIIVNIELDERFVISIFNFMI
jgi:hypothetical protein